MISRFSTLALLLACRETPATTGAAAAPELRASSAAASTTVATVAVLDAESHVPVATASMPTLADLLPPDGANGVRRTTPIVAADSVEATFGDVTISLARAAEDATRFRGSKTRLNGHGVITTRDTTELFVEPSIRVRVRGGTPDVRRAWLGRCNLGGLVVAARS